MSPENTPNFKARSGVRVAALIGSVTVLASACVGIEKDTEPRDDCEVFRVYAQNRWSPLGAAVRTDPDILSEKLEPGFAGNEVVAVDGWVSTGESVYPTNPEPWDSDVWFHLATREGWVNYAAVRGAPTSPDIAGFDPDGGEPAPTPEECKLRE